MKDKERMNNQKESKSNFQLSIFSLQLLAGIGLMNFGVGALVAQPTNPHTAVEGLVLRIAPQHAEHFMFETLPNEGQEAFELQSNSDQIVIKGTSTNAMAVGFHYYLTHYCHTYVSWYTDDPVFIPQTLPRVPKLIRKQARVSRRFFFNYCTFGYTMPWWQWKDWERMIDWMALNGVNMPLAITGQEAVWYEVWKSYGLTDEQIRSYFTGPAHLPWHRMSNLDRWGGPLPLSWLKGQQALQQRIVKRQRTLGMTPVLPAFSGHVPEALKTLFPKAKINRLSSWGGFKDEYRSFFLDPLDTLFKDIQRRFLVQQAELFGTNHVYGVDPFNEVHPPSWSPEYLATVAQTIYTSITAVDPQATWLQMSWIFYFERKHWTNERIQAMVRAVPQNKMVLLDYYCENTEVWKMTDSFFGQPFLWCYLGNFGGNTMLAGNLETVNLRIENALKQAGNNLWGIGSTLEALDMNPVLYAYVLQKAWDFNTSDTEQWIKRWAQTRYGGASRGYEAAWKILLDSVYTQPAQLGQATLTNARPTLSGSGNWTTNPDIHYQNTALWKAWQKMLAKSSPTAAYQFDVVNIGRQVLGNEFLYLRDKFASVYQSKDIKSLKQTGKQMLALLSDLDELLATSPSFLLGKWLNDAKAWGKTAEEQRYYEHNARNIITTWGTKAQSLNDYGNRSWAGLTKGYYKKRWEMFIQSVIAAAEKYQPFDKQAFFEQITQFEWDWTQGSEAYADAPKGDPIKIARRLLNRYERE